MAHNNTDFKNQHKPSISSKSTVPNLGWYMYYPDNKRVFKMGAVKIAWFLADILGLSSLFLGWINGIDTAKTITLFVLGAIYASLRIYFYWKKSNQDLRMKELDILEKERELNL